MCDASNFEIGAALLQEYKDTTKMNPILANSRLFIKAEFVSLLLLEKLQL